MSVDPAMKLARDSRPETEDPYSSELSMLGACLRQSVGAPAYERWFSQMGIERADQTTVTLSVPNDINQYWIEDNFMPPLRGAITSAFGGEREVLFRVMSVTMLSQPVMTREAARQAQPLVAADTAPAGVVELPQLPISGVDQRTAKALATAGLNSRFTFDSFVEGPNCSYSVAIAKAVAEKPGKTYNPLFLHGAVGLGKTHLMHAIGREILRTKPRKVVRYVTSESFTNDYIEALRMGQVPAFRAKYRKVDVLLIDDIEFLGGKGSTQEEFFHTFNDLFNSFKQIVLTCDSAPSDIKNMEDRLVSRFEWGMATRIAAPDVETRMAILKQKMCEWALELPDWALKFIAENVHTNIRRLEGALMRLGGHVSLSPESPLTPEIAENLLKDMLEYSNVRAVSIDWIQKVVAEHFDVRLADMTSRRRPAAIAVPRQIAMYLSRELTKSSLKEIGAAFGGKDHGTVIHACKSIAAKMEHDEFRRSVSTLSEKVRKAGS